MSDGFSPPEQVRKNAARSLELRKEFHRGMTAVGVARARDLSNGANISADTIKRMHSYFARHEVDKKGKDWANQSNPSAGYIAWLGWGGDAGRSWVNGIIKKLNTKESQEILEMASTKAATIRGIFLKPGVSKNRRLYTKNNIAKAVERMNQHLAKGEGMPLNMATSHAAAFKDDATSTVGRITSVKILSDGSAAFEAEIANTAHGRDVANLAAGKFIKGVSIRGEWVGEPRETLHSDGEEATTADDLMIHGVDFTNNPGVEGAEIQYAVLSESYNPLAIFESIEDVQVVERFSALEQMEEASKKPYGDVAYADPGYQKDKVKRYPINGAGHVRSAWSYINQPKNANLYTAAQLSRIKSRIKSAAKKYGVNIISEQEALACDIEQVLEAYASIALVNDDDSISITGYATDPHQLKVVANRIAFGAIAAMHAIDPDDDGDIYLSKPDWSQVDATGDAGGTGPEDEDLMSKIDDNNMECANCGTECVEDATFCHNCGALIPKSPVDWDGCDGCGMSLPQDAFYCSSCAKPVSQAESSDDALNQTEEEVIMTDDQTTAKAPAEEIALESTATRTLTDADLSAMATIFSAAFKAIESTPEEEVTAEVAAEEEAVEAPAEVAAEEVAAEESIESQENIVSESLFTVEQVQAMIAEAAKSAAEAAVAETKKNAVEAYRNGGATFRKGFAGGSSVGNDASDLSESEELDPRKLSEMSSSSFRRVQAETWGATPFFAHKFAQADRGF
jgi:hypothetical protein